jgi:hypothetical protein
MKDLLKEVSPFVVLVGSYGRGKETPESDMNFYVRRRKQNEIERDKENDPSQAAEESYIKKIAQIASSCSLNFSIISEGHLAIEKQPGIPTTLVFGTHYRIPVQEFDKRRVNGVDFITAVDNKDTLVENLCDYATRDKSLGILITKHPLPFYDPETESAAPELIEDFYHLLKDARGACCYYGHLHKVLANTGLFEKKYRAAAINLEPVNTSVSEFKLTSCWHLSSNITLIIDFPEMYSNIPSTLDVNELEGMLVRVKDIELNIENNCDDGTYDCSTCSLKDNCLRKDNSDTSSQIQETAYKKYQMHWIMVHGYSVDDICRIADSWHSEMKKYYTDDEETTFSDHLFERGFGGSLYACQDEFLHAEYMDEEYMKGILTQKEYEEYHEDVKSLL